MPPYRINYVNHAEKVWGTDIIDCADDAAASQLAERLHVPGIGYGFDLWDGDRLVHSHRDRGQRPLITFHQ